DLLQRAGVVEAEAFEALQHPPMQLRRDGKAPLLAEVGQDAGDLGPVLPQQLEKQPLEVAGDLDVHGGQRVGCTGPMAISPRSKKRARMSLLLEPTTRRSMGRPMARAAWPAKTLPKLPVGTAKLTARSGAPSERAAVT